MSEWTIQKLLNWITQYFTDNNIDAPRLSAEILMSHILRFERIELYTNFDKAVNKQDLDKLHSLVGRCIENEPIQYLTERTEFYSLSLKVSPDCLIPRPETELLVERAIERVFDIGRDEVHVVDDQRLPRDGDVPGDAARGDGHPELDEGDIGPRPSLRELKPQETLLVLVFFHQVQRKEMS